MATQEELESMRTQLAQLQDQNDALQASMENIQQKQLEEKEDSNQGEMDDPEPQPLSAEIWDAPVPENFKPPHLSVFDGKSDPMEHITTFNTRMAVVGAPDSLKCKLLTGTFSDAALRWYMNLPRFSILSYQDMTRKLTQQFSASRHRKVSATSLFNVRQGHNESLRDYLARFNDTTIKVTNPNQEVFVGAFQNGLRAGQFNESLAQKPADSMEEIMARAECYIKGEESNAEKKARDARERAPNNSERRPYQPPGGRDRAPYRGADKRPFNPYYRKPNLENFTPLNTKPERIMKEIYETKLIPEPPPTQRTTMGEDRDKWCKYHKLRGHDIDSCIHLRREIEKLIQSGKLRGYTRDKRDERPKASKKEEVAEEKRHTLNTISGGFAGGGESSSSRKKYVRQVMLCQEYEEHDQQRGPDISFSARDYQDVVPHDDDPMVITLQIFNWDVKRVLIDPGSSADILYYDTFDRMGLDPEQLQPFKGTLAGFTGEQVHVRGYITLKTTFGSGSHAKTIRVRYLVINSPSSYNIIIGRPSFNLLGAFLSAKFLVMKYPLNDGKVGTIRGDQKIARECYHNSLRLQKAKKKPNNEITHEVNMIDLDPREDFQQERLVPTEDLKEISIGPETHHTTKIGTSLSPGEETTLINLLRKNLELFAWSPSEMPGMDPDVACHHLSIKPGVKPVVQRKRKMGEERRKAVDHLIDSASGYKTLSFMDAYSRYNQIRMDPLDAPKTAFMTNTKNYHYEVMSFGLKNAGTTFQRSMDATFSQQIGRNLEVYIDDLVAKTKEGRSHADDLEEILSQVRKYRIRLNPAKCSFGVQAGKFLGFLLTRRGIEANPEKCQAIISMRSPSCIKEVQQLTGRLAALSRFLSCAGDKAFSFFASIKKKEKFEWTPECEETFLQIKSFLSSPHVLQRPSSGAVLFLYLAVSENAMSTVLVEESETGEQPIYFVSRVLKGAELRYQKIERLALAVVTTARKLRPYFQSHKIVVKSDYPIKQVLGKPDLAGRMVAWSIELSEYDVQFVPRGSIKSQVLADFVVELSSPAQEKAPFVWLLSVDGSSNLRGSGAGVVLEGPDNILIEQSLRFEFKASNNQAEYEALIAGMTLAQEMGAENLRAKSDSQLITSQISGEYQTKDAQLSRYLAKVQHLAKRFILRSNLRATRRKLQGRLIGKARQHQATREQQDRYPGGGHCSQHED